ncbi:MAG TPA: aldehyde dehydrogenase family protein [Planctomycetota bacterium]|nr:aldehyde dehydrogenase family protein [Planctomycetota bacterium]
MRPALLLVDLQNDFLRAPGLEPPAGEVVARAKALLEGCRARSVPVVHVRTTVAPGAPAMPHWEHAGVRSCLAGTDGHAFPPPLRPVANEPTIDKTFYSGFGSAVLEETLRALAVDTVLVAGVHLHGCVRATVLDAYQRGFAVLVAEDAVGSHEPFHAASTRRWLDGRAARFLPVARLLATVSGGAPGAVPARSARGVEAAHAARPHWRRVAVAERGLVLDRVAAILEADAPALALRMARETGKPVRYGLPEVARGAALLRAAARRAQAVEASPAREGRARRRPHGVVGLVTPWNSPLAIPLGKIGPALAFGNTAAWKPSPVAASISSALARSFLDAGAPPGALEMLEGDADVARALMEHERVRAISVTGSPAAGAVAQEIAARRRVPLQAELGGNNGAIVWADTDLDRAAARIAEGAFGQAGQRCTANRRVIVDAACLGALLERLVASTAALVVGDPEDPATHVGPLVSSDAKARVEGVISRAREAGAGVVVPHGKAPPGAFVAPTIVTCDDPRQEIATEETFGPVLVVQRAETFARALELLNGVRQGLAASLFSPSVDRRAAFLEEAEAGILKLDEATADAGVEAPFGGWKASGVGPPEHGDGDVEFYTRAQALYG